jgi:trimethylamine--corrinoid protein Co-methyltransferase
MKQAGPSTPPQSRRKGRRRAPDPTSASPTDAPSTVTYGGQFTPLTLERCGLMHQSVLQLLEHTGMAAAPPIVVELVGQKGGTISSDGRLLFPPSLVGEAISAFSHPLMLCGQHPKHDLPLEPYRVFVGTGGAAPTIHDPAASAFRPSTLKDLYDAARLADRLDHVHFFSRPLIARDMPSTKLLDINTAFASLAGTTKHTMVSASSPEHVRQIAALCYTWAGSEIEFRRRPFLSLNINHAVPPMRFDADACLVLIEAIKQGIPASINTFGQVGASSPVTLAGAVAQTLAETFAGLIIAYLVNPAAAALFGPRPMITDLRTGAMSGGSGEQALVTAMAVQMANYYQLPNSTIAGAADSKLPDAQSGYEKSLAVTLAAQSGANLITQACGMQAGLLGVSLESYVIDNDMLGGVLRALQPVEFGEEALAVSSIDRVVRHEGHFLGETETYARMRSDFLYPDVANRQSPEDWHEQGGKDVFEVAQVQVRQILDEHFPPHLSDSVEHEIRDQHDIRLNPEQMRAK